MSAAGLTTLGGVGNQAHWLRLPGDAALVFTRRAARLRALAPDHIAVEWIEALAALCDAQAGATSVVPITAAPPTGPRPLAARDPSWRAALASIVAAMRAAPLPRPASAALARLGDTPQGTLDRWADAVLAGTGQGPGDAAAPFVAAALQASYTERAARLTISAVARVSGGGCPACGFAPVAGVVDGDDKRRYLSCGLCAAEWNVTRIQCASCGTTGGISYYEIEGGAPGIKAEACAACRAYLKLFYREQLPAAEPLADDAATLALDLLLGEEGWARAGVNLLVHV